VSERPSDGVFAWAAAGSRASGFNHDTASKLQSLMMSLDEASELSSDPRELQRALETAMTSVKELHALLTDNRALTKPPVAKTGPLAPLLQRAAARYGIKLRGELPAVDVRVAPPSFVHAVGMLADVIAGPASGTRTIDVAVRTGGPSIEVSLSGQLPAQSALDAITVASWMLEREGGQVHSAPLGFQLRVPAA